MNGRGLCSSHYMIAYRAGTLHDWPLTPIHERVAPLECTCVEPLPPVLASHECLGCRRPRFPAEYRAQLEAAVVRRKRSTS